MLWSRLCSLAWPCPVPSWPLRMPDETPTGGSPRGSGHSRDAGKLDRYHSTARIASQAVAMGSPSKRALDHPKMEARKPARLDRLPSDSGSIVPSSARFGSAQSQPSPACDSLSRPPHSPCCYGCAGLPPQHKEYAGQYAPILHALPTSLRLGWLGREHRLCRLEGFTW